MLRPAFKYVSSQITSISQRSLNGTKSVENTKRAFSTGSGNRVFLVGGKRTPFAKYGESFKDISPVDLAVSSSKALLRELKVAPTKIEHVIFANVVPATTDTIYGARHTALKTGCSIETPAYTVNRLCGSGIQAITDAKHMIQRGEAQCVLVSGSENMSMSPHLVYGARFGTRFGALQTVDMLLESLTDKLCNTPMAITAENLAEKFGVSRQECDKFSWESHLKAVEAYKKGYLQGEICPVPIKKGEVFQDEHIRTNATLDEMSKLKATFKKDGTVTAGTASGIVDGAASVLIASEKFVQQEGLTPIAEIGQSTVIGVEPTLMGIGPSPAIKMLLEKTGMSMKDIDLFEINEAFAAQTLAVVKDLKLDSSKLNVWGGAVAIGHPLGATGVRTTLTLGRQLKTLNKNVGITSACIGGGQGIALLVKRV